MMYVKLFLLGWLILIGALALNGLAHLLQITTWYEFAMQPAKTPKVHYLWLFVVYPFLLGVIGYIAVKLTNF